jgi:hypothetical protein
MRVRTIAALLGTVTISACMWNSGGSHEDIEELIEPRGVTVYFARGTERHNGELLGFRGDTAFVFADKQIYAINQHQLRVRGREVSNFPTHGTNQLANLRREVRYSQGISPELEAVLLARIGQAAVLR